MYEDQERVLGNGRWDNGKSEVKSIKLAEKKYRAKKGGIREANKKEEEDAGCCQ